MTTIFFDTNVLVDQVMDRGVNHLPSLELLRRAEQGDIRAMTTASNVMTFMYLLEAQKEGKRSITERVEHLLSFLQLVPIGPEHFLQGFRNGFNDLEDAVLYQAAIDHGGIDIFVTVNIKDFRQGKAVAVRTPIQCINELDN